VNLSDLAAMGARPLGFTLAIAMPAVNASWLEAFSNGLFDLAKQHQCPLIGGDTTAGPLTISITIFGRVSGSQALTRDRAQVSDDIWVSHQLGDAHLALGAMRLEWPLPAEELDAVAMRMHAPTPRVELGQNLLGVAHAAIDISDGFLGDLSHILRQSNVSAEVFIDQVPGSAVLNNKSLELQRLCKLMGGDDYELCFTAPPNQSDAIHALSKKLGLSLTAIGKIKPASSQLIELVDEDGHLLPDNLSAQYLKSFDHFK
jgi:thiamine-monophosphate kinase